MIRKFCLGVFLVASVLVSGCVIEPVSDNRTAAEIDGAVTNEVLTAYRLKPLDPIYIRFNGIQEQTYLDAVIDEKGEINLLHIVDPIKAAGLTTSQLEDKIEQLYITGGIYRNVSVNVTMTAKVFYVEGEVQQPGQFQLTSGTTLRQAIAGARGYTQFANRKNVTVTRQGKRTTYNMKAIEKDPSKDVKIEAGDVIKVSQSKW